MPRLSEDKIVVIGSMKVQLSPPSGLLTVGKHEEAKPQAPGECKGASLMESESFMSLTVKNGHDMDASTGGFIPAAFRKLKMLTSEACHKNYVIFDRCEGKSTVIVHPSWLKSPTDNSMPELCFAGNATYCGGGLESYERKETEDKFDFCSLADFSTAGLQAPLCNDAMGMYVQPKIDSSNKAISSIDFLNPDHAQKLETDAMGSGFISDKGEESCEEFHENTEEIDALLSSGDELSSTGHSPSDEASNGFCDAKDGHANKVIAKKRKLGHSTVDEVDDADSGPRKLAPNICCRDIKRSDSCLSLHVIDKSNRMDNFSGAEVGEVSRRAGKRSAANDAFAEKSECESMKCSRTCRGGSSDSSKRIETDSSKRIEIKNHVQQLKSVLPGGDCLDTAGVLCQTIKYVKCLQRRLRDLKAAR